MCALSFFYFFFFNDTATTEIYTLSLHDALPISDIAGDPVLYGNLPPREISMKDECSRLLEASTMKSRRGFANQRLDRKSGSAGMPRPISYAVFCLKKKNIIQSGIVLMSAVMRHC